MADFVLRKSTALNGPVDGVESETIGVYTKYKGKNSSIIDNERTNLSIKAAVSTGVITITDVNRKQGISMSIAELAAILNMTLREGNPNVK